MATQLDFEEVLPGTRRLFDENGYTLSGDVSLMKAGDIVLVPQPTDSPNDPLGWSLPRKLWHTSLVLFVVAFTAATSNNAGSGADDINTEFGIDYAVFNTGAGVLFLGIGFWCLLGSPAVYLYGRRVLYLFGMLLGIGGNVWYARIRTSADAVWSQLFVGASESVAEATVQLSLLDIWFEHQNGSVLGLYTLATSVGTFLGPLIASYIADSNLGWPWIGWFAAIFSGMALILIYFGFEETTFRRDRYMINRGDRYLMDGVQVNEKTAEHTMPPNILEHINENSESKEAIKQDEEKFSRDHLPSELERHRLSVSYSRPKSYFERIRVITPAPNLKGWGFQQYINRLWHTCRVFAFPAVWYAGLQWGLQSSALTFYLTVEQSNWAGPPWNYSDAAVGNMNIPCLIGSVIGCFYGGYISDKFVIWRAKRNRGISESEVRLWLNLLCAAVFPTGMFIFGVGSAQSWAWPAPYVGLAFIGFGWGCAGDLSITYLADSYPDMVLEGMVGVAVINNSMACIFSFVTSYWITASGVQNTFIAVGVISFAILMLTVPMMIFGKRARRWTRGMYLRFLEIRDGFEK